MSASNRRRQDLDTEALMAHVGAGLRAARKATGKSQEAVAVDAGIHRTEVGLLERGKRMPRYDTILKLAGSLEVEPGKLFDGVCWVVDRSGDSGRFEAGVADGAAASDVAGDAPQP